jgi:hypothetical protein
MTEEDPENRWCRPAGTLTLKEIQHGLQWFGVDVSFEGLRQTARLLRVPSTPGRGERGRGVTAYYTVEALWMFATAYRRVASPKSKFEKIAEELSLLEGPPPEPFTLEDFIAEESVEPVRDLDAVRNAYVRFVCDDHTGLDPRIVTDVARSHWHEVGLDDERLETALRVYKIRQLEHMGVPSKIAEQVSLGER